MLFGKKKENEILNVNICDNNVLPKETQSENIENIKQEDEWIWVDGYKGTDKNLVCRDMQYELNKTYVYEGNIKVCESGFHLCKTLNNVFNYYALRDGNRFFKVKALVKKMDFDNYCSRTFYYVDQHGRRIGDNSNDKLTAKEIIFLEELKYTDLLKYIERSYQLVKNEDDWNLLQSIGENEFNKKYFLELMINYGYSNAFALVLYADVSKQNGVIPVNIQNTLNKAKAFKDEGVSADMSVYLLLQK